MVRDGAQRVDLDLLPLTDAVRLLRSLMDLPGDQAHQVNPPIPERRTGR